jgi:hypothetical protein
MQSVHHEDGRYRVLLKGVEDDTPEKRETFCRHISEKYHVSFSLLENILDRCPIILKKNLTLRKAETLARTLKQYGGLISVEEKRHTPPLLLEFQETVPRLLALESSRFWKTEGGTWTVTGRVKNICDTLLNDVWVLIQFFENPETLLTFEEAPIALNPLPPGEGSPFRVLFEGGGVVRQISIAFKNSAGAPLSTEDRRKKREWADVEVEVEADGEHVSTSISPLSEAGPQTLDIMESTEELSREPGLLIQEGSLQNGEAEPPSPVLHPHKMAEPRQEKTLEEPFVLALEGPRSFAETKLTGEIVAPPSVTVPAALEEINAEIKGVSTEKDRPPDHASEPLPGGRLDISVLQEATHLLHEIDQKTEQKEADPPSFPWMEQFRDAITRDALEVRDPFSAWFQSNKNKGGFESGLHSLVTLLAHARFDQVGEGAKGLENTRRVSQLIMRSNLSLDEIPSLEATQYFSAESWRNLFYKAIPRLQNIGRDITARETWDATELERLIQVIPHMSGQTSRRAVRWMGKLTLDVLTIDFSNTPVIIGESLYRVAARLGVVAPLFDTYQDVKSMGYTKIQSFAKTAFPQDPAKMEDPMTTLGMNGNMEGHCYPIQPHCEGCLFEGFCPKLHISAPPAEKRMNEDH